MPERPPHGLSMPDEPPKQPLQGLSEFESGSHADAIIRFCTAGLVSVTALLERGAGSHEVNQRFDALEKKLDALNERLEYLVQRLDPD